MLNQCHIGDCRTLLREFAAAGVRVQTCVTSPPYFGLRDYGVDGQIGLEPTPDEYVAQMVEVFRCVRDVLADDGTLWLNLGDSYANAGGMSQPHRDSSGGIGKKGTRGTQAYPSAGGGFERPSSIGAAKPKDLLGIPWRVAFALQADGWYLRSDIIWSKPNPMPESVTDRPTKAHEYLFLLAKAERYYYDAEAIGEPFADERMGNPNGGGQYAREAFAYAGPGAQSGLQKGEWNADGSRLHRNRRSVWTVASKPFDGAHFAVFPSTLIEPCILAGSRPGDVVLDPFMGSGTTAQVAEHLGRQWIGCELNPSYLPLQAQRLAQRAMAF